MLRAHRCSLDPPLRSVPGEPGRVGGAASLAPLLDRLAAFRPDVIAVEELPGRSIETYLIRASEYGLLLDAFPARFARARELGGAA